MNGPADLTHPPTTGSGLRVEDRPGAFCDLRTETRNQLFVDPAWWDVLREAYGFEVCVRQVLDRRDEVVAAVPWVEIDDLGGHRIVSLPFCDFVDAPITADAWTALAPSFVDEQTLVSFSTPASHELTADPRFASQVDGVHHRISVTDPDTMVGGFAELTRRMIRKAERSGPAG